MKCRITIEVDIPDQSFYSYDFGKLFVEKIVKGYCYLASLFLQRDLKDDESILSNRAIIKSLVVVDSQLSDSEDTKIL